MLPSQFMKTPEKYTEIVREIANIDSHKANLKGAHILSKFKVGG